MANRITVALVGFRGPTDNRRVSVATEGLRSGEEVALGAFFDCTATMFANPIPAKGKGGATWKHLWTPLREAATHEVKVKSESRVRTIQPETYDLRQSAEVGADRIVGSSRVGIFLPQTSAVAPTVSSVAKSKVKRKKPKTAANTPHVRIPTQHRVNTLPPVPSVVVMPVPIRGKTHYAYWTPETIQNPTDELMYLL